jgi:hypothetical protein
MANIAENIQVISTARARKILGEFARHLTDEQIADLVTQTYYLAGKALEAYRVQKSPKVAD